MIDTKLILIEGIPGSGKTTTAVKLAAELSSLGIRCQYFHEWAKDHPIFIGHFENLSKIISSSKSREQSVLQQWQEFTKKVQQQGTINIIESRFWHTNVQFMYAAGHSEDKVTESSRCIVSVISKLNPLLIYLEPHDIEQHLKWTFQVKNKEWQESGREGSWEQWLIGILEQQNWFTDRGLKGHQAVYKFFTEWSLVAERLYAEIPFPKTKIW